MYDDLECPYCGAGLEVCHDDGEGYDEDQKHKMECSQCGKMFVFTTSISFNYEPEKADCLNDGKHDYKITSTFPKAFSKMSCSMCDEERELTDSERLLNNIETEESYFKAQDKRINELKKIKQNGNNSS